MKIGIGFILFYLLSISNNFHDAKYDKRDQNKYYKKLEIQWMYWISKSKQIKIYVSFQFF